MSSVTPVDGYLLRIDWNDGVRWLKDWIIMEIRKVEW